MLKRLLACVSIVASLGARAHPTSDAAFLRLALLNGTNEIDRAQIAAGSTHTAQRNYALVALSDVTTINTQLEDFAHAMGVRPGTAVEPLMPPHFSPAPSKLSIEARDRLLHTTMSPVAYFKDEIASRQQAFDLFEYEAARGTDARVRGYAKNMVSTIASELARARSGLEAEQKLASHRH